VSVVFRLVLFLAFIGAVLYIAPQFAQKPAVPSASPRPIGAVASLAAASPTPSQGAVAAGVAGVEAALKQATQSGKSVPITLRMTDADLTTAAQPYFPQSYAGITVADPSVRLGPALTFSAKASSFLLNGALVASATPYAADGRLTLRLDSATIGGVVVPDALRSQLQQQLQNALNSAMPAKLQVATVNVATGVATISGVALP
jgi:hypothetical protein